MTTKTLSKANFVEPKIAPDTFRPDNIPLDEQLQGLLNLLAFKTPRVVNTGLEDMDDYFARATEFLGQFKALEMAVQILRDTVENAD
jgi:hypothetical protein